MHLLIKLQQFDKDTSSRMCHQSLCSSLSRLNIFYSDRLAFSDVFWWLGLLYNCSLLTSHAQITYLKHENMLENWNVFRSKGCMHQTGSLPQNVKYLFSFSNNLGNFLLPRRPRRLILLATLQQKQSKAFWKHLALWGHPLSHLEHISIFPFMM